MSRRPLGIALALPPLALATAGLFHPHLLLPETAGRWTGLHVALLPVWPLLGVVLVVLLRAERGVLAWLGRLAALVYVGGYTALDAINGIAAGFLYGAATDKPPVSRQLAPLFAFGNVLGWVGSVAFLVGAVITVLFVVRRSGPPALVGGVLTVAAAVSFLDSHIYWPRGVLTMLVLAAGFALLAVVPLRRSPSH